MPQYLCLDTSIAFLFKEESGSSLGVVTHSHLECDGDQLNHAGVTLSLGNASAH